MPSINLNTKKKSKVLKVLHTSTKCRHYGANCGSIKFSTKSNIKIYELFLQRTKIMEILWIENKKEIRRRKISQEKEKLNLQLQKQKKNNKN